MIRLTEDQERAVNFEGSHLRILAGPGSGKTRVLVQRIDDMITRRGVSASNVTAITFTRKAAGEMLDRLKLLPCGEEVEGRAFVGTAHAFAARVLRTWGTCVGYSDNFTIYDERDEDDILAAVVQEFPEYKPKDIRRAVAEYLTGPGLDDENPGHAARLFLHRLRSAQAVTFDVLIYEAIRVLRASPKARAACQAQARILCYDEVQDFNVFDYRLIQILEPEHLTVVGDLNQNIYGFRGTSPHFLDTMPEEWPGMETIHLADNFRSGSRIVDASNALIVHNPQREDALVPRPVDGAEKGSVHLSEAATQDEEAATVASQVENLIAWSEYRPRQVAILTRTHAQHRRIAAALDARQVPNRVLGRRDLWKDPTGRAILATFRLIFNPRDDHSFGLVVNWPRPRATKRDLVELKRTALEFWATLEDAAGLPAPGWNPPRSPASVLRIPNLALGRFVAGLRQAREFWNATGEMGAGNGTGQPATPSELLQEIRARGLDARLRDLGLVSRLDILDDLVEWIVAWEARQDPQGRPELKDLLEALAFRSIQDEIEESTQDQVLIMTAHAAKGLEWANVFVAGLEAGTFPIQRKDSDPDEERRLFYVAMTRAETGLWLSRSGTKETRGDGPPRRAEPSPFLFECQPGEAVQAGPVGGADGDL